MSIPKRMDKQIKVEDDYSIDEIMESAGILSPEQAKVLVDEVKRMREDDGE